MRSRGSAARDGAAAQQGGNLDRVERAAIERRGERGGRVELERLGLSVHRDQRGLVRGIHLEASTHLSAGEAGARVVETQQDRHRHLRPGPDALRPEAVRRRLARRQARRQGRAEPGPAVAVPEAPDLEGRRRDELVEPVATPRQPGLIQGHLERPERQRARSRLQPHLAASLARCGGSATARHHLVARLGQPLGDSLVVEIVRQPHAGIRALELHAGGVAREQERPGVHGRRQEIRPVARALGVEKGQLRQREQAVVVARRAQPAMQLGEHRPRRLVEPIQEPEPPEHRLRGL